MAALRKIVLDPKWLNNLHFYVRFRWELFFDLCICIYCLSWWPSNFMSPWFPDSLMLIAFFFFMMYMWLLISPCHLDFQIPSNSFFSSHSDIQGNWKTSTVWWPSMHQREWHLSMCYFKVKSCQTFWVFITYIVLYQGKLIVGKCLVEAWLIFLAFWITVVILGHFVFSQVPILYYENPTSSHWPQFSPIPKAQAEQRGGPCWA